MPTSHLPKLSDSDFRRLQQMMLEASGSAWPNRSAP